MKNGDIIYHVILGCYAKIINDEPGNIWYSLYGSNSTIDSHNAKYWVKIMNV